MTLDGVTPFPPEFARRYRERGYWEDRPLGEVFVEAFRKHGDRVAVVAGSQRISYRELDKRSEHLARHLLDFGIRPTDRVVMHLPNIPEFVYLYFALQRVGAVPLMALPQHREYEISHYLKFVDAKLYLIAERTKDFDFVDLARRLKPSTPTLEKVIVAGHPGSDRNFVSVEALLDTKPRASREELSKVRINPDDPCVFQLSGGTTGIPKVIPRSNNDYVYNTKLIAAYNDIRPDDALLIVIPIAHNFPLASPGLQGFFLAGARVVLENSTRGATIMPLIEREQVTHLEIAPALVIRWLDDLQGTRADTSSVRVINTGGQKFQPETKARAEVAFPRAKVQEIFGMAEGLLMIARLDDPRELRLETAGRPMCPDDEVRLIDDDGNDVSPGEPGELIVRGPYTLRGYYKAPEVNESAFTPDGFYKSGDVLRLHPSGNYVVEGRKKDLVNRGGEKISTEEVEGLLLSHPAVAMVACVAMPDRVLGERMCAFVVPRAGHGPSLADLTAFLSECGIAKFKHPERLEVVDQLPISPFGKIKKNELAARIAEVVRSEEATDADHSRRAASNVKRTYLRR